MPQNIVSDLGLQFLPLMQQYLDTSASRKMDVLIAKEKYVNN